MEEVPTEVKASGPQQPSKPAPSLDLKCNHDVSTAKNPEDAIVVAIDDGPLPMISLANGRFAARILLSVGVFVSVLSLFAQGVPIHKYVWDTFGSSTRVDELAEIYQVANGVITKVVGDLIKSYVAVFVAVATIFLRNVPWYPGDDPSRSYSPIKRLVLWAFFPVVMYNIQVAIAATFVSHTTTGFLRVFSQEDLQQTTELNTAAIASRLTGNRVSIQDTILRGAVLQKVVPFQMNAKSSCLVVNESATYTPSIKLPTVKELRSTAVVYGFPARSWNIDALPFGLVPNHSFVSTLDYGIVSRADHTRFLEFRQQSKVSWLTLYEMFLQGTLLFERSVSDSDATSEYPCSSVDNKSDLDLKSDDPTIVPDDPRNVFWEGRFKGKRRCFGAVSSLGALGNISDPKKHNLDSFLSSVTGAFLKTADQVEPESMNLTIEVYNINQQLKLTSMTLDLPYYKDRQYRNTSEYCNGTSLLPWVLDAITDNTTTTDHLEYFRNLLCDQTSYPYMKPYLDPRATCGPNNCIFLDQSGTINFKKQLQLMPYLTNCSTTDLQYDAKFRNFFPSRCLKVDNAVFLYGLGSYMSGARFDSGEEIGVPFISNPRRHIVLTFAKLEWTFHNINTTFGAECGIDGSNRSSPCSGLLYDLENVTVPSVGSPGDSNFHTRVLVLGESQLPKDLQHAGYRTPVQLLSLNTRPLFYPNSNKFYEWEYLNLKHLNWTDPNITIYGGCSALVDSYISTVETNKYFMDDPRQPLYSAALFYLFQDAAVKTVNRSGGMNETTWRLSSIYDGSILGTTTLKGDLQQHQIVFKVPLFSLALTFGGLLLVLILAAVAVACPAPRLRTAEDPNESVAHQYARLRTEDEYPRQIFGRQLKLRTGKRVILDDYVVESLTLHHKANPTKKAQL